MSTQSARGSKGPLALFSGSLPGTVLRLGGLAIIDAFAIWFLNQLIQDEAYTIAVVVFLATLVINLAFLFEDLYPFRWFSPGLVLMIIMVLYPTAFTIYVAFTNFSTGNLLTEPAVIERIETGAEYRFLPQNAQSYFWTGYRNEAGEYLLLLEGVQDGELNIAVPGEPLEPLGADETGLGGVDFDDDGNVIAIEGFETLTTTEAANALSNESELAFDDPLGTLQVGMFDLEDEENLPEDVWVYDPVQGLVGDFTGRRPDVYNTTLFQAEDGTFAIWMAPDRGETFFARQDGTVLVDGVPQSIREYAILQSRDLPQALADLPEIEFGTSENPIRYQTPQQVSGFQQRYFFEEGDQQFVDRATGALYEPAEGTFTLVASSLARDADDPIDNADTNAFRERFFYDASNEVLVDDFTGATYSIDDTVYRLNVSSLEPGAENLATTDSATVFRDQFSLIFSSMLNQETGEAYPLAENAFTVPVGDDETLTIPNALDLRANLSIDPSQAAEDISAALVELGGERYVYGEFDALVDASGERYPLQGEAFAVELDGTDIIIPLALNLPSELSSISLDDDVASQVAELDARFVYDASSDTILDETTGAVYEIDGEVFALDFASLEDGAESASDSDSAEAFQERYKAVDNALVDQLTGAAYDPRGDTFELDVDSLTAAATDLADTDASKAFREAYTFRKSFILDSLTGARYTVGANNFVLDTASLVPDDSDLAVTQSAEDFQARYTYSEEVTAIVDTQTGAQYAFDGGRYSLNRESLALGAPNAADSEESEAFRASFTYIANSIVDQESGETYPLDVSERTYSLPDDLVIDETLIINELSPGYYVFVGPDKFEDLITDSRLRGPFIRIFVWTITHAFLAVFLTFAMGLGLALLMNDTVVPYRKVFRSLILIPYAIPPFISTLVWRGLLNPRLGLINDFMTDIFGSAPAWYSDPTWAKVGILLIQLWLGFPYMLLICTGALQSIPSDIYQAAEVDGAGPYQRFRFLTLPLLLVAIGPLLIASFAFNFNNFTVIELFNQGGPPIAGSPVPAGHTDILITYTYAQAFGSGGGTDYALASAISIIIFIIVATITLFNFRFTRAWEEISENV